MNKHDNPRGYTSESLQKEYYNSIIEEYEAHHEGPSSRKYKNKFLYDPMFENIELKDKVVLEAMCGSGQATEYLLSKGARVAGLDISDVAVERFKKRWRGCEAIVSSISNASMPDNTYDCVVVVGGLHHLHPFVDDAVDNVYRILKVHGYFCFMEPHAGSFLDRARKLWYKCDRFFEVNEASIDVEDLKRKNSWRFHFVSEKYGGNIGYFLVLQSMILRIPLRVKTIYAPMALWLEKLFTPLQSKSRVGSSFVICQWKKLRKRPLQTEKI